jgi:hypothetical protein
VSLIPGTIQTPLFTTDLDERYEISLEFDRRSGIKNVECLLGLRLDRPDLCEGVPDLIDVSWKVLQRGEVVAEGDSTHASTPIFAYPQDTTGRITGGPHARRSAGVTYSNKISFIYKASEHKTLSPTHSHWK